MFKPFRQQIVFASAAITFALLLSTITLLAERPEGKGGGKGGGGGDDETSPYIVTDLGGLPGWIFAQSVAYSLNDPDADGNVDVVGDSIAASGSPHAVHWRVTDTGDLLSLTDLGTLPGGTESRADDVNNLGEIVGSSATNGYADYRAVFIPAGGSMVDLGTLRVDNSGQSRAFAVNDVGLVVGQADVEIGNRACVWYVDEDGVVLDKIALAGFDGRSSRWANDVNNSGQVVGQAQRADGSGHAASWQVDVVNGTLVVTGPVDLAIPGLATDANGINATGDIAGTARTVLGGLDGNSEAYAFLLTAEDVLIDLGTIGGAKWTEAQAVNDHLQVVGRVDRQKDEAYLWELGVLTTLNDLIPSGTNWQLKHGNDINNNSQIVGLGRIGTRKSSNVHGYLLTPRP